MLQLVEKGSSTEWRELAANSDFLDCSRASDAQSVAWVELTDIYAGGLDLDFDVNAGTWDRPLPRPRSGRLDFLGLGFSGLTILTQLVADILAVS